MAHLVLGLMSGTSADGIDAVLAEIGSGKPHQVAGDIYRYPPALRRQILALSGLGGKVTVGALCRLNFLLGEFFAAAALRIIQKTGLKPRDVHLIGSHGQTVCHLPQAEEQFGYPVKGTLQLGEGAVIAQRTGITTVCDFRPGDMAAGGQGAPLLPLLHFHLFNCGEDVIVQNIGGIGNLTLVPASGEIREVLAFDTGPGNMLLDGLMAHYSGGRQGYDHNGAFAAEGKLSQTLLEELLRYPFLAAEPPKSCGREEFGAFFQKRVLKLADKLALSPQDVLLTLTVFSARTMIDAYEKFICPRAKVKKILVCGGGRRNLTLMFYLQNGLDVPLLPVDDFGVDGDFLEAMGFALLAREALRGRAGNLPGATGAVEPVILGKIAWGRNYRYWQRFFSKAGAKEF